MFVGAICFCRYPIICKAGSSTIWTKPATFFRSISLRNSRISEQAASLGYPLNGSHAYSLSIVLKKEVKSKKSRCGGKVMLWLDEFWEWETSGNETGVSVCGQFAEISHLPPEQEWNQTTPSPLGESGQWIPVRTPLARNQELFRKSIRYSVFSIFFSLLPCLQSGDHAGLS